MVTPGTALSSSTAFSISKMITFRSISKMLSFRRMHSTSIIILLTNVPFILHYYNPSRRKASLNNLATSLVDTWQRLLHSRFRFREGQEFQNCPTPDFKQIDVWKSLLTSEAARRCGILGAITRTYQEFYVCMNYHNIPLLPQRDSLTSMSYMLSQKTNLVTYWGTTGAMLSWGGFSSWRSKQPGQKMDLSVSPQNVHMDVPPRPSLVKACFNPLPEPPDPELVAVHAPSSTPDVDVMFGVSLLGKIRDISLFSAAMAKVRVYQVKYVHKESALLAEGFTV